MRSKGKLIVIDHVPADVCTVCGDVLLSPETVRHIEGILKKTGKPVLRGGFRYSSPRLRPAIAKDLLETYARQLEQYEAWVKQAGFAGYERELGDAIPGDVSENFTLLAK